MLVALSSIGLPGLNGFVGEFLILIGAFGRHPWITLLATTGVVFAAYYMLPMIRRAVWNDVKSPELLQMPDLSRLELAVIVPLLLLIVLLGVYPKPFIERIATSAELLSERITLVAESGEAAPRPVAGAGGSTTKAAGQ